MDRVLVVVSHYNAWATDQLVKLLDQMQSIPSGHPFESAIVVNQAEPKPLDLPPQHSHIRVIYRENVGFNIGAWDHGWRQFPDYTHYLFLQEECQILHPNWLKAFLLAASRPGVGMVGESIQWRNLSWERILSYSSAYPFPDSPIDGRFVSFGEGVLLHLDRLGIAAGKSAEHLQSLVLFASREVLEKVDGFLIGKTYGQAIASEVAITKRLEAVGLKFRTVGIGYFRYILHPQWKFRQFSIPRFVFSSCFSRIEPLLPIPVARGIRDTPSNLKKFLSRFKRSPHAPKS